MSAAHQKTSLSSLRSKISLCVAVACVRYPPVVCLMPLGLAVVPLVYSRKSRSSAFMRSGSHVVGCPAVTSLEPIVAPLVHEDFVADAFGDEAVLDRRRLFHRDVAVALERNLLPAPPAVIGGDDRDALRVVDAIDDRIGRESAEDHRVRRADARARQHRDRKLGNHRHVDRDAIAFLNAELAQTVGKLAYVVEQLLVGDRPAVAGFAFVIIGDLVAFAGFARGDRDS